MIADRVCNVGIPVLTLARYILETTLMEYSLNIEVSESKLAAAALVLALIMKNITSKPRWSTTVDTN